MHECLERTYTTTYNSYFCMFTFKSRFSFMTNKICLIWKHFMKGQWNGKAMWFEFHWSGWDLAGPYIRFQQHPTQHYKYVLTRHKSVEMDACLARLFYLHSSHFYPSHNLFLWNMHFNFRYLSFCFESKNFKFSYFSACLKIKTDPDFVHAKLRTAAVVKANFDGYMLLFSGYWCTQNQFLQGLR